MPSQAAVQATGQADEALAVFSQCHAGIVSQLQAFADLPALQVAATQAREVAAATLTLFRNAVLEHHADEEIELFPAVLRSAAPGEEAERVRAMVERLSAEHRSIESRWKDLEPLVKAVARGKPAELDLDAVGDLVCGYLAHARFEEQQFLPLAEAILGRDSNHMAALGLSLHLRHAPQVVGYI